LYSAKLALGFSCQKCVQAVTAAQDCVTSLHATAKTGLTFVTEQDAARNQLVAALARIAGGDRSALRLVYRDTSAKLFGVCLRILGDTGEAEDVLQDVYLTIWRRAAMFEPSRASPITWMVAIARNRSIDRLRASATARRMKPIDDALEVSDGAPGALEQVETAEQSLRLMKCLNELEERHAVAIRAAFLDGATYEMLAERMDVPLGTMKTWIRRSLIKLRACLER
jgi:RNA polymerase sigma factor (sigma-70 family)